MSDPFEVGATLPELAQHEVDRRWPSPNSGLYEGLRSGFLLGAAWASDQDAVHLAILRLNPCHCGKPVASVAEPEKYESPNRVDYFCGDCITVRCDAFPGACQEWASEWRKRVEAEQVEASSAAPGGVYSVERALEEWVATCTDYPSMSWVAATPVEALAGLAQAVREVTEDMKDETDE